MAVRRMQNSGHGGPPGTRVRTIFVFGVNPQIPNIENLKHNEVYKSPMLEDVSLAPFWSHILAWGKKCFNMCLWLLSGAASWHRTRIVLKCIAGSVLGIPSGAPIYRALYIYEALYIRRYT